MSLHKNQLKFIEVSKRLEYVIYKDTINLSLIISNSKWN